MKHVLWTIIFSLICVVPAFGFEAGDAANFQIQAQDLAGADYGLAGADSKYVGGQLDIGVSSTTGGVGMEYNYQIQGAHINAINSTGNVRHQYDIDMSTRGASDAYVYGTGGHIEVNGLEAGISTLSDSTGTTMVNGADISANGGSVSGATFNADGVAMTDSTAHTEYENVNVGPSSAQYGTGISETETHTVAYSDIGFQAAGARAETAGEVSMMNDGSAGVMASGAKSHSEVDTATVGAGAGYSSASARAANVHTGQQVAFGPGTYQYQETVVATGAAE